MQVATSRLDIVNETDAFTQKVQHQADHLRQLKKRAMSIPVIGSIVGTVGGILLIKMLMGKKSHPGPGASAPVRTARRTGQFLHIQVHD